MDILTIDYAISDDEGNDTKHWEDIIGAVRVTYNGTIITKLADYPDDEGYFGFWIFYVIGAWMRSVKQLVIDGKADLNFLDGSYSFRFKLENDKVIFLIDVGNAEQNQLYPGEGKGYLLPARLFLRESVTLGHRFIDEVISSYKNMDPAEIKDFGYALDEADHYVSQYLKSH